MSNKYVNAIRVLSADTVQKANSGHPGIALGCAPICYELFANQMKHNPKNPTWKNRDRFILSAGHGSSMLYSILHLFSYGLTIEDLKNFRQLDSKTPGHPEYGHTIGVEATTGPLGAGMAMAVGMAMAEEHLASIFNKPNYNIVDHHTFVLGGDGCMMEGISSEAFSLAGTLKLSKLIVLYDSNKISIEGDTDLVFDEDIIKRFESYGFGTFVVEDGNNLEQISKAITDAKNDTAKPSFILIKTKIGHGCPAKEGKASSHGEPLGVENIKEMRKTLCWEHDEDFFIPEDIYEHYNNLVSSMSKSNDDWNNLFEEYKKEYPDLYKKYEQYHDENIYKDLINNPDLYTFPDKPEATRNLSQFVLDKIKDTAVNVIGGSADLAPSTKTYMNNMGDFTANCRSGRNLHFGVRELAMAGIANGIALHGGLRTYVATFFVFSDYVKPMARLSALMNLPVTYVLTHDSIGVGEDGPTHEPIEQLAMLRSMPNFYTFRPCDARETIGSWTHALASTDHPCALVLTRQALPQIDGSDSKLTFEKGGYIISKEKEKIDAMFIATGSEVSLALEAKKELEKQGMDIRVVSLPCVDLFEQQTEEYKNQIMPKEIRNRVIIEAGSSYGLEKYKGLDGHSVTIDTFGASAPFSDLLIKFGFTKENIINKIKNN